MKDLPARDLRAINEVIDLDTTQPVGNLVRCICPQTGILAHIAIPSIKEIVFSYSHPLADISNCKMLIKAGHKQLIAMERSVLAGMVLTCFKHYGLVEVRGSAIEANRILCLIPPYELSIALHLVEFLNHTKASVLPKFSLEWATYAESNMDSFRANFKQWTKLLSAELVDISELEEMIIQSTARGIAVYEVHNRLLNSQLSLAQVQNAQAKQERLRQRTIEQSQKEAEAEFRRSKARAKVLVSTMLESKQVEGKLAAFLITLCQADNLKALDDSTRDKVIARVQTLQSQEAKELVFILQATANPFDLFDTTLDAGASEMAESLEALKPKKTIAEILAEKQAARLPREGA